MVDPGAPGSAHVYPTVSVSPERLDEPIATPYGNLNLKGQRCFEERLVVVETTLTSIGKCEQKRQGGGDLPY